LSDGKNSQNNSKQETVTENPKRITELEAKLAKKDQEIQERKQKTSDGIKRIKQESKTQESKTPKPEIVTNLPARIIKQNTFGSNFHNGYADGTVKKATKELRATQRKASVGKKQ